jgi:hypothetical protein
MIDFTKLGTKLYKREGFIIEEFTIRKYYKRGDFIRVSLETSKGKYRLRSPSWIDSETTRSKRRLLKELAIELENKLLDVLVELNQRELDFIKMNGKPKIKYNPNFKQP